MPHAPGRRHVQLGIGPPSVTPVARRALSDPTGTMQVTTTGRPEENATVQFTGHFDHFLTNTVNLPKGKIDRLDEKMDAVYRALKGDVEMPLTVVAKIPQGSGPQKTIINPPLTKEFDADFLLEVEEEPAWDTDPRAYRDAVAAALKRHPVYGKMPRETKSRCVRVIYAGDFHLDVVPFVRRAGGQYIVNGDDNTWEATDPTGFTNWFNGKNSAAGGHLRPVLRIMKYLRDTSDWGGTRSVLLTILAGERVSFLRPLTYPGCYSNVPSALVRVMEDLDTYLQAHETIPPMPDPAGSGTSFDHRWEQATYDRLRTRVHAYAPVLMQAYLEKDPEESLRLWQSVLGEKFTAPPSRSPAAEPFGAGVAAPGRSGRAG